MPRPKIRDIKYLTLLAAWAEPASGPGWANQPVWCLFRDTRDGSHVVHGLQPHEVSAEVMQFYRISAAAHLEMTSAVQRWLHGPRKRRKP